MKIKSIKYILGVFAFTFALTSCDKNEDVIQPVKSNEISIVESKTFGQEYPYADTLKVYANDSTYVVVKISSNKEDALKLHLLKYEPYLKVFNGYDSIDTKSSDLSTKDKASYVDINTENIDVIKTEIIDNSGNLTDYVIGYKSKTVHSNSGIQKATIYPQYHYYEYTSDVHDTYFKLKLWHIFGVELKTLVKFGYVQCWLCSWQTEGGFFPYETWAWWEPKFINNPWSNDGLKYDNDRKYKLGVGIYSQTPDNHQIRHQTYPIQNW